MAKDIIIHAKRPLQLGNFGGSPVLKTGSNIISEEQYERIRETWFFGALISSGDIRVEEYKEPEGLATIEVNADGSFVIEEPVVEEPVVVPSDLAGTDSFELEPVEIPKEPKKKTPIVRKLNRK